MKKHKLMIIFILITILILLTRGSILANKERLIDLDFKEADLRDVLRLIAELAQVNLVTDGSVAGTITIHLNNISFDESLILICRAHGLDYKWFGKTVIIAKSEKINEIYFKKLTEVVKVNKKSGENIKNILDKIYPGLILFFDEQHQLLIITGEAEEVEGALLMADKLSETSQEVTQIIVIDYLDLENLKMILTGIDPELNLQINKANKEMIITGKKKNVEEIISLIKQIDSPRKQVLIEARVEEVSRTALTKIGITPDNLTRLNFLTDKEGQLFKLNLTWPEFLELLEAEGSAQTLANPHLLTINGERAKLQIGDRIPIIVEEESDDKVIRNINYIDAGISLEFKPWVTEDNYIYLEITPKVNSIGESIGGSLPAINTREAETRVRLKDGQTFAIGGLIRDDHLESVTEVPFFSELPFLGQLFRQKKVDIVKKEVIIFITPYIVKDEVNNFTDTENLLKGRGVKDNVGF